MPLNVDSLNAGTISQNGEPVKPYKVYTALLTQSGTDTESSINSGFLTIGVTYTVNQNSPGMDFTNVGAPNNKLGTRFVATGTIPNSWGDGATYTLAYSEGAPVVTVLENTLGVDLYWIYQSTGFYYGITENKVLTENKTFISTPNTFATLDKNGDGYGMVKDGEDQVLVVSFVDSIPSNDVLNGSPIEIRVYN